MAKGICAGIGDVARKTKKMYGGVGDIARKVKKKYVGIANVARLAWSAETKLIKYGGSIAGLSSAPSGSGATSVGSNYMYALFAGGRSGGNSVDTVDAYNTSLTRSTPTALSASLSTHIVGVGIDDYALFVVSYHIKGLERAITNAYNTSLTRSTPTALSMARLADSGARVGNYALFVGGHRTSDRGHVEAYTTE